MDNLEKLKLYSMKGGFDKQSDLAVFLDVDPARISEWKKGKPVQDRYIQKLEKEFGIIEKDGDTIKFNRNFDQTYTHLAKQAIKNKFKDRRVSTTIESLNLIPVHYRQNVNSAGGYGALNDDESAELIMVPAAMLVAMFGLKNFENLDIIHVTGDSMKPIVEDGDTIMIRRTSEVNPHKVAVVRVGDKLLIKYIDYHPSGKWVKLYSSDRAAYRDMDFEGDEVNEIEVIGVLVGKFKPY